MKQHNKNLTGLAAIIMFAVILSPLNTWASTTGDFTPPSAPGITVGPGYTNALVYETIIPDGTNGAAEDTLIYTGSGATPWGGDTLISMGAADHYFLDDSYEGTWAGAGAEAVWIDTNSDTMVDAGEIQVSGLADLEGFLAAGANAEYVFDNTGADNNNYDSGEAIFADADGSGTLNAGDTILAPGFASVMNFNLGGPTVMYEDTGVPACAGTAANGYDATEPIWIEMAPADGIFTTGLDIVLVDPTSCLLGVGPFTGTAFVAPAGPPDRAVFLDTNHDGLYTYITNTSGEPIYYVPVGILPAGSPLTGLEQIQPPYAGPVLNIGGTYTQDWTLMSAANSGNLYHIGTTSGVDTFTGVEAIVDDGLGVSAGVLEPGEEINSDTAARGATGAGTLHQGMHAFYGYNGASPYDNSEFIFDDGIGAIPFVLEKAQDRINAITLQNTGSAVDTTDITNIQVWADGGNTTYDNGGGDDILLGGGPAVWDGVNSWDLAGLTQLVNAGGLQIFVSTDIAAAPTHGNTIQMQIPMLVDVVPLGSYGANDEGLFMISNNEGPTDAVLTNANIITIDAQAPVLQSFTSSTPSTTYGPGAGIAIEANYDESLTAGSTMTVVLDNGKSVLLNNVAGTQLWGTYTVGLTGSGSDSLDLTVGSIAPASESVVDLYGNTQTASGVPGTPNNIADTKDIIVDTTAPQLTGSSTALSNNPLTDADVGVGGGVVRVEFYFNETMDNTTTPDVVFQNPAPAGLSLNPSPAVWDTAWILDDRYTSLFDLADLNETSTNFDLNADLTGVTDIAGNLAIDGLGIPITDIISIDTQNPIGTASVGTDPLTDSDYIQEVTITYDEAMDISGANDPVITFGATTGVITSNADGITDGIWTSATTWYETFTITDGDESTLGVTVTSSGAKDANGNIEGVPVGALFDVETQTPVVTIVLPSNGNNTRLATPLAVTTDVNTNCTYDLDAAGPVAVANTGGTVHTDVLGGLAAGAHTVVVACTTGANTGTNTSTWTKVAPGNMVLLGTDGAGANPAAPNLYTLDPETGNILTTIGLVGFNATGMAVDPTTGILYGTTGTNDPTGGNPLSLITIDLTTGAGTLVGPARDAALTDHNLADIAFDSTGQLYGWSELTDELFAVNKTTGALTLMGANTLSTSGSGLIFDLTNTLYLFGDADDSYWTINKTTGLSLSNPSFLNPSGSSLGIGSAAVDSANIIFANRGAPSGGAPWDLIVPEQSTGIIVSMGGNNLTMQYMNALAVYEDTYNPVVTITAPTKTKTGSIADTTVRVVDYGGLLAANVTATGGALTCLQTSNIQVDCTSVISASGNLVVNATDSVGNLGTATEAGYTINSVSGGGSGGSAGGTRPGSNLATTAEEALAEEAPFVDIAGHWAEPYIDQLYLGGYIEGYSDNTFMPDQYITRAESAKLIALWFDMNVSDDTCMEGIFDDVNCQTDWFAKFVGYLYIKGVVEGYGNGDFMPGNQINRAEALKMMLVAKSLQNLDFSGAINPFSDVLIGDWHYNFVMIGYKLGIIEGYPDGTFKPGNSITRAEFTKIFTETLLNN